MDNFLLTTLDEMERRTEKLRQTVREAESERLFLLKSLTTMSQSQALVSCSSEEERNELELFIDRLTSRLLTIDIIIHVTRTPAQEESLGLVRQLLRNLRPAGPGHAVDETNGALCHRATLERYRNSCLAETDGPVDCRFQATLLGCAGEDQKEVRAQLEALWEAQADTEAQRRILASMGV